MLTTSCGPSAKRTSCTATYSLSSTKSVNPLVHKGDFVVVVVVVDVAVAYGGDRGAMDRCRVGEADLHSLSSSLTWPTPVSLGLGGVRKASSAARKGSWEGRRTGRGRDSSVRQATRFRGCPCSSSSPLSSWSLWPPTTFRSTSGGERVRRVLFCAIWWSMWVA